METNSNKACGGAQESSCGFRMGSLPSCAPLAVSYVPMQAAAEPRYEPVDALTRGTLFPGLDLPFMNTVNRTNPYSGTPLGEVMALRFMMKELQLYLDTHPEDKEAFALLREVIALYTEAKKRYARRFGSLELADLADMEEYDWVQPPSPWEFAEREARS